ncbi:MAG: hypothetical protein QXU88_00915 [Candidatus Woesearchaeota archaeon]
MAKAQGLPINTIIIVALALVVLLVIAAIFTGRIQLFGRALSNCPKGEGKWCTDNPSDCAAGNAAASPLKNCNEDADPEPEGSYCCIPLA